MRIESVVTDGRHADFLGLAALLDEDLNARYGGRQWQYDQFNAVDLIRDVVVIYADGQPAACGAFKAYDSETVEIKRVFVRPECRGRGLARRLMGELERRAASQGYTYAVLETGIGQPEAIRLYGSLGYTAIANYGPYAGDAHSVCMRKALAR